MTIVVWSVAALVFVNLTLAGGVVFLRVRNDYRARRWHRIEGRWYPALLDLLAGDTTCAALLKHVEAREVVPVLEICGRLARRVSGDDRKIVREFARPLLGGLGPSLASRHPEKRANAIQLLTALGTDDEFNSEIAAALNDPSPLVSMVAARVVASRRRIDLTSDLLDQLDRFEMWSEAFLASMLASMGSEIAPQLRAYFSSPDCSLIARSVTARALAELRDVPASDIAVSLIAPDVPVDRVLTIASLRVIEAVGQSAHLEIVRPLLGQEDAVIRARAATVLGKIGTVEDGPALAVAVGDEDPWVAIHAATALQQLGLLDALRRLSGSGGASGEAALEALAMGGQ
jgi:HEAT repeat protein